MKISQSGRLFWQGHTLNGDDDTADKSLESVCAKVNVPLNTQAVGTIFDE